MTTTTPVPLEERCEWRADEVGDSYIFHLTDDHVAELDAALAHAESRVDDVLDISRDLFPLPTLGSELARITDDLVNGPGMVLIRGVPVGATARTGRRPSTGASARTSATPGRRTPRATCWAT